MDPVLITSKGQLQSIVDDAIERSVAKHAPRLRAADRNRPELNGKAYLTNAEAQKYLGLSKATLARYRADGTLPFSKIGQSVYYRLDAIEGLLDRSTVSPRAAP